MNTMIGWLPMWAHGLRTALPITKVQTHVYQLKSKIPNHRTINATAWSRQKSTPLTLPPYPALIQTTHHLPDKTNRVPLQFRTPASPPPLSRSVTKVWELATSDLTNKRSTSKPRSIRDRILGAQCQNCLTTLRFKEFGLQADDCTTSKVSWNRGSLPRLLVGGSSVLF
jgi:hypothetical protein